MTRSAPAATSVLQGSQWPRVEWVADGAEHPDGQAALELVAAAGLQLDPWQQRVLSASLLQRNGKWAAFEVGLVCPRQNGKNALLEARELAGLFVLGEQTIIHSAHLADTSREAFRRLVDLIDANDWLSREVAHVWRTNGHEAIELKSGQRVRFRTRTKGGGRGFSGDLVVFDEAMIFPEESLAAILPIVSARPNPQAWYAGSAVDQAVHDEGQVFARIHERGLAGDDDSLTYFEWSLDHPNPADVPAETSADPEAWAQANPALGIRISPAHVANEHRSLSARTFAVERLGVGDWPTLDGAGLVIPLERWNQLADPGSTIQGQPAFAFDVSPDRSTATVAAAGRRPDGLPHVEVIQQSRGTGWLTQYLAERVKTHQPSMVVCDAASPAGSLLHELAQAGVTVTAVSAKEHADACGQLFDAVAEAKLRHLGTPETAAALRGAAKRPLGDAWAWSRKSSAVDITPLVAQTLALWAAQTQTQPFALAW